MPLPPKGTPQRERRDKYQLKYRKKYKSFHVMLDPKNPRDEAILNGLNSLPYKTKTEFLKRAVEEKLGLHTIPTRRESTAQFIAKLDEIDTD